MYMHFERGKDNNSWKWDTYMSKTPVQMPRSLNLAITGHKYVNTRFAYMGAYKYILTFVKLRRTL